MTHSFPFVRQKFTLDKHKRRSIGPSEAFIISRRALMRCHPPRRIAFPREFRNEGLQAIKLAEGQKSFVNERP